MAAGLGPPSQRRQSLSRLANQSGQLSVEGISFPVDGVMVEPAVWHSGSEPLPCSHRCLERFPLHVARAAVALSARLQEPGIRGFLLPVWPTMPASQVFLGRIALPGLAPLEEMVDP